MILFIVLMAIALAIVLIPMFDRTEKRNRQDRRRRWKKITDRLEELDDEADAGNHLHTSAPQPKPPHAKIETAIESKNPYQPPRHRGQ